MDRPADVTAYFEARARAMMRPSLGPHLGDSCPLPVFTATGTEVVQSTACNRHRVRKLRACFAALGVTRIAPELLRMEVPSRDRLRVTMRLWHCDIGGPRGSGSDLVYYLRCRNGFLRTEMIEILNCPAYALLRGRAPR